MANLTLNMIYRVYQKYIGKSPFNDWIGYEKDLFNSKKESGKITTNLDFKTWLNKRYAGIFKQKGIEVEVAQGAEGQSKFRAILKKVGTGIKDVGKKVVEDYEIKPKGETGEKEGNKKTEANDKPKEQKEGTILGLKKPVFIMLSVLGGAVVITTIILIVRSNKSNT